MQPIVVFIPGSCVFGYPKLPAFAWTKGRDLRSSVFTAEVTFWKNHY